MTASTVFLPWVRHGLAAQIATPDPLASPLPGQARITVGVDVNGSPIASMPVRLASPGEVIGIDPRQVVRLVPPRGSIDFESNNLASIEFDNPDLPWMFTPAAAAADGRLRPWMVLVVVRQQAGVRVRPPRDEPLPVLEIGAPAHPSEELPDLADSWAWAHAQLSARDGAGEGDLAALLATRPELSVSRLIGARLLAPFTDYVACVVPAFDAGRRAGLGEPAGSEATLSPAWKSGVEAAARIALPVYYQWEFRTGEREDFESLVDKLRPRDLSGAVGRRPMDIGRPGFATGTASPAELELEGALQPVDAIRHPWPDASAAGWHATLRSILNATNALAGTAMGTGTGDPSGDTGGAGGAAGPGGTTTSAEPIVGPPIYGRWYARRHAVGTGAATWLDDLNLDPRERVAAGLGTRVIQEHQEALVAQAWEQAGQLEHVNQRMRQMQLSLAVTTRLHARHVMRLADDDSLWRLAAPAQARLPMPSSQPQRPAMTLQLMLAGSTAPLAATSPAMRRLARPRGAISRRADVFVRKADVALPRATGFALRTGSLFRLFGSEPMVTIFTLPPTRGLVSFDAVARRLPAGNSGMLHSRATDMAVLSTPARPAFQIAPEFAVLPPIFTADHVVLNPDAQLHVRRDAPQPRRDRLRPGETDGGIERPDIEPPSPPPRPPRPPIPPRFDSPDAKAFREAAGRHLAKVNPQQPLIVFTPIVRVAFDAVTLRAQVQALLDPAPALMRRMRATILMAGDLAPERIGPLGRAPRFSQPMSEPLARLSQDWLLPGLERVPVDTVAMLQPNRRFIEAFMVGVNVEMGRELLWRDYPLPDERSTCFRHFWSASDPAVEGDVDAIGTWGERRLGAPSQTASARQVVLLLRSTLLRRYPNAVVYAVPAARDAAGRRPGPADNEKHPIFRGSLQPDVSFFGFELDPVEAVADPGWYFVIAEQPTEPRFGFDVGIDFGGASHVPLASPPPGMPLPAGAQWARNAAHMARITRQQPMRVAIHASELIASDEPPAPDA